MGKTGRPHQRADREDPHHGRLRRRDRPGHDEHPVHDLRPRRRARSAGTSSSTSRSCRGPAGSSTTRSRSGSAPARSSRRRCARPACGARTLPRSASPTSARPPWCGTRRTGGRTTTPSSGRTPAPTAIAAALERDGRGDVIRHRAGLPPATYFSGGKIQWILENVDGVREAAERGRRAVRHHRHLAAVEPHRRRARRRARHRRHQRQPHHADGPRDPRLGRRAARRSSASRGRCCRRSAPPPTRPVRRHPRGRPGRWRGAPDRRARRPAGRDGRAGLPGRRRGQEHLRHRQLPAAEHRRGAGPLRATAC